MEFDALAAADRQDLIRLADLLETGLLSPPLSALSLRDHIAAAHADAVAQCFGELTQRDMPPGHIALLLRAFAAGAKSAGGSSLPVEVVVSGPDATGGTRDTGVVMRQLFGKARERVLAVGFAVRQGKSVFKSLADRLDNDESSRGNPVHRYPPSARRYLHRPRHPTALRKRIRAQRMARQSSASRLLRSSVLGTRKPYGEFDACQVRGH